MAKSVWSVIDSFDLLSHVRGKYACNDHWNASGGGMQAGSNRKVEVFSIEVVFYFLYKIKCYCFPLKPK